MAESKNKNTKTTKKTQKETSDKKSKSTKSKSNKPKKKLKYRATPNGILTAKMQAFCRYFIELNNGTQAAIKAGYKERTAVKMATENLSKPAIKAEIARLRAKQEEHSIMTAQQVMEMFTKIANGEIKDQFGLEASLNDRLKALQELAKRTIDIDNKIKGVPDGNLVIKVDWQQ